MALPNFPYTDFHRLNADWVLKVVRTCAQKVKEAAQTVETYADRLLQVETDVTLLEGSVSTVSGQVTALSGSAVQVIPQTFSDAQKTQARTNIGAVSASDIPQVDGAVRYDTAQSLSDAQKNTARTNIGAASSSVIPDVSDVVRVTEQTFTTAEKVQARDNIGAITRTDMDICVQVYEQTFNNTEKAQARDNIGAASASDIPDVSGVVRVTAQTFTSEQKEQARINIYAEAEQRSITIINASEGVYTTNADFGDSLWDVDHDRPVWVRMVPYGEQMEYSGYAKMANDGYAISATLRAAQIPADSLLNDVWYNVSWIESGGIPVLTVTKYNSRLTPASSALDAGKVLTVGNMGVPVWTDSVIVVNDTSSTAPIIASALNNHIYKFTQDLVSLAVTAGSGSYMICFHSGSTPTAAPRFPADVIGLDDFTPVANTYYEINIMDGRAVWYGWADPSATPAVE